MDVYESLRHTKWERKWMSFRFQLQDNVARIVMTVFWGGFPQVGCVAGNRIENGCGCGVRDMKISILQKYEIIRSVSTVVEATVNSIAAFKRLTSTGAASATPK